MANLEEVDPDQWAPLYEPTDFNEVHGPLTIEEYRLPEDDLKTWAERCSRIREAIVEKSRRYMDAEPEAPIINGGARTRRGQKLSKAEHNVEGLPEAELRRWAQ